MVRSPSRTVVIAASSVLLVQAAAAACLTDLQAASLVAKYLAREPAANPEGLSKADGACSRAKFNTFLAQQLGSRPVGYKAGLTNPAVQQRFGTDAPVWGRLYASMLLPDGSTVDTRFGARPLFEADLLVRVRDAGIHRATTPEEVLRHIDQVIPFIELPDLVVQAPPKLDGAAIAAINVGARLGVMGTPIAVQQSQAFSDALRDMAVVVKADGAEVDRGKGSDVLGHPLNAVIWLAQDLRQQKLSLRRGDLISLGSFSKLLPPQPGMAVEVTYEGLPGNPSVRTGFR